MAEKLLRLPYDELVEIFNQNAREAEKQFIPLIVGENDKESQSEQNN